MIQCEPRAGAADPIAWTAEERSSVFKVIAALPSHQAASSPTTTSRRCCAPAAARRVGARAPPQAALAWNSW